MLNKFSLGVLPDKPSELLALALDDMEKILKAEGDVPAVRFSDATWIAKDGGVCHVCLAGCLILGRVDPNSLPTYPLYPSDFPEYHNKLWALDYFRVGAIRAALDKLGCDLTWNSTHCVEHPQIPLMLTLPRYSKLPEPFLAAQREIVTLLTQHGL